MPRCDYDVVFYRVFCITLLCVAFSFTVILTNVFIDIDGLLYNKEKGKTPPNLERVKSEYEVISLNHQKHPETYEDYDYPDTERSKRSLDSDEFLQDVRDVKLKKYFRNHFAKYFDEAFNGEDEAGNDTDSSENKDTSKNDTENLIKDIQRLKEKKDKKDNEMLHLAIHNIVLQGIIGHMDLKEVYKKAHELAQNLEHSASKDKLFGDNKLINELMDCKDLQNEIMKESVKKASNNSNTRRARDKEDVLEKKNNRNIFIKTLINITSLLNDQANQQEDTENKIDSNLPPEEITGMIKLIYNGRELKFKKMETTTTKTEATTTETNYLSKTYLNNMLKEYLKQFTIDDETEPHNIRLKRKADAVATTVKPHSNEDDELFVEIETHVGTKGLKGEKKKKIIRDLVDKIQKALHSDKQQVKKKHKNLHVKKRIQNPLDRNEQWIHSIIHPEDKYYHRQLNPISKSVPVHEHLPYVADHEGNNWKKYYSGPHFLDPTKGINSAEMSQVEAIYDRVPDKENDIPKRLQLPLMGEDNNYYYNKLGNLRFLVKDIEGSGFSIGYNQYTDEAPDPDSMKLFAGLENVIQTYHRKYDENDNSENQVPSHDIARRSIKDKDTDYHSNEYKIIFNNNFLPYNNYHDITNQRVYKKTSLPLDKAIYIDDSLFNKNLKPAEILSLANYFGRDKRSVKVRKISNVKLNRKKVNRYINTKAMAQRSLFIHKRRNKRQIDKIRIIARDMTPKKSEEEIFVVSDESNYGDRPIMKHNIDQIPQDSSGERYGDHYEVITPSNNAEADDHIDVLTPYMYESQKENTYDVFSKISRQNSLMSKYPHIFLDELNRRNDDEEPIVLPTIHAHEHNNEAPISFSSLTHSTTSTLATVDTEYYPPNNMPKPILNEYESLLDTPDSHDPSKKNYKLTIKITPKNSSAQEGFKEIHTSVNKSYNQNGMIYTSMLNVSELSKVEQLKLDKRKDVEAMKLKREEQIKQIKLNNMSKLKAEHDKIKKFIDLHKNRLEEQLKMINFEKDKLDKIYQNDELLLSEHFKNASKDFDSLTEPPTFNIMRKADTATTTTIKETTPVPTTTENPEQQLMYDSIHKNENVTKEILSKINKNNDLLKTFLEKIINKLEFTTTTTTEAITTTEIPTQETTITEMKLPEPYEQMRRMFFKNSPTEVKNDTNAVPFIYMYQHPINISQEPANILYHGHIHSDLFHKMKKAHEMDNIIRRSIENTPSMKQYLPINNNLPINNIVAKPFNNVAKTFNNAAVAFNNVNNNNIPLYNSKINMLPPFNDNIRNDNYNVPLNYQTNNLNPFKSMKKLVESEHVKNGTRFFIDDIESDYKPLQAIDNKLQKN